MTANVKLAERLEKLAPYNKSETIIGRHSNDCGCRVCAEVRSIIAALRSPAQEVVNLPQDEDGTYWRLKNGNLYSKNSTTQIGYGDMRAMLSILEELEGGPGGASPRCACSTASTLLAQSAVPFDNACLLVREMEDNLKKIEMIALLEDHDQECPAFDMESTKDCTCWKASIIRLSKVPSNSELNRAGGTTVPR